MGSFVEVVGSPPSLILVNVEALLVGPLLNKSFIADIHKQTQAIPDVGTFIYWNRMWERYKRHLEGWMGFEPTF
ncbi:hypothetical protein D3C87_666390 [compost metagenome]